MHRYCFAALALLAVLALGQTSRGANFFYTGPANGDFFDELNWNSLPGGGGANPAAGAIDPATDIFDNLFLDGVSTLANGKVQFGAGGGLDMQPGSLLDIVSGGTGQLDLIAGTTFNFNNAMLIADDDIFLRGTTTLTGGSVTSRADDIEFLSSNTVINGTSFTSGGSSGAIIFRETITSIFGASFNAADRLGLREFDVTMTDSTINVNNGEDDVENVFTSPPAVTATLTLKGNSSLLADQLQEDVKLALFDNSVATLANVDNSGDVGDQLAVITENSLVTLHSTGAKLIIPNPQTVSSAPKIRNGQTGLVYSFDPSTWNVKNWNGLDAVTLQIVPEPSGLLISSVFLTFCGGLVRQKRRR